MVADEAWLARPTFLTAAERQNPYRQSWSLFFKHLLWPTPGVCGCVLPARGASQVLTLAEDAAGCVDGREGGA
jgi:hypothetical protein